MKIEREEGNLGGQFDVQNDALQVGRDISPILGLRKLRVWTGLSNLFKVAQSGSDGTDCQAIPFLRPSKALSQVCLSEAIKFIPLLH